MKNRFLNALLSDLTENDNVTTAFTAIAKSPVDCHREGQDEEVQCWHCGTALHHWPRENIERFSPSLQLTLRLESTLLRSLSGQAPDPFWVGNVDAETFANLVAELFALLAEPDCQGANSLRFSCKNDGWSTI